jgi:hypothetical protein
MKLTHAQLATLQAALRDYEEKTEGRAFGHPDSDFWKEEYANARTLHALLESALSVEVESVHLTQATAADHSSVGVPQAPSSPAPAAPLGDAAETQVAKVPVAWTPEVQAQVLHALASGDPNGSLEGWADPAADSSSSLSTDQPQAPILHSTPPEMAPASHDPCGSSTPPKLAEKWLSQPKSLCSSAEPTAACGDINCDGQGADRPPLIILIDQCASVDAALREVADATAAARLSAARYLRTDRHALPGVIERRVRRRLACGS